MSRASSSKPETVTVAPSNNIYTVLAVVGFLTALIGLAVLFLRQDSLGVQLLKM